VRARPATALALLAPLGAVWAFAIWLTGGFTLSVFGTIIVSHHVWRPVVASLLAAGGFVWIEGFTATRDRVERLLGRLSAARLAGALACAILLTGLTFGTWTASGPDPYAYLSQAALWRTGHLEVPVPLAREAPWPHALAAFTPWGYGAAPQGVPVLVPMTAPGLPLLMAAAQRAGGFAAAFVITPVAAAVMVWLTFLIARQARSSSAGLIAAWLVVTSPALLFMVMWPMTDVPAAACSALMVWLLLQSSSRTAFLAGLAGSLGLLLRPTFATLLAGAIIWLAFEQVRLARRRDTSWRLVTFALGVVPGVVVTAGLNLLWHGSLFASGYGSMGNLLALSHLLPNALRYSRWLATTSPIAAAGIIALIWFAVRAKGESHRTFFLLAIVAIAAWLPYLLYDTFDDWWYLRFLLPAWPAMCVAAAAALDAARARGRPIAIAAVVVVVAAGVGGISIAGRRGVFALNERRYATVARLVATVTEPSAVVVTVQHSGTIRFYAGRQTLRWDVLDSASLDSAIAWLAAQHRHPYLLIEDWEEPQFESRFANGNRNGRLSWAPVAAWQSIRRDGWIFLFDPLTHGAAPWNPGPEFERAEAFCPRPAADPWPR
jgi:hypothetical protein